MSERASGGQDLGLEEFFARPRGEPSPGQAMPPGAAPLAPEPEPDPVPVLVASRSLGPGTVALAALLVAVLGAWSWHADRPATRLGSPAPAPAGEGGYAFLSTQPDGRPVTFDPCRPVHYVVRPDGQPAGGPAVIAEAVAEVSRATGLVFVADGASVDAPDLRDHRLGPRPGDGEPPPVLVAWSTPRETPELAGDVAGVGTPAELVSRATGASRWVSGQVVLDAEQLRHAPGDAAGERALREVLLHELGHLVGLDHVDDPAQLMHASASGHRGFADGDLRGLHVLGLGDCA